MYRDSRSFEIMNIRKTTMEDLPSLEEIYAYAREQMKKNGNPHQWGDTRPGRERLIRDIEEGIGYVLEEKGTILGAFAFFIGNDPCYDVIEEGSWLNHETYGVIHRVANGGKIKGMMTHLLDFCEGRIGNLRIDTHHDNHIMQHLVEKNGFQRCGIVYMEDGSPRIAYQRCGE